MALYFRYIWSGCSRGYDLTSVAVEHVEHIAAVCSLHGGGVGIFVARHDFNAETLELDGHFFAELAAARSRDPCDRPSSLPNQWMP